MGHPLALTGERTLPGIAEEGYWFARHVAGYRWAVAALGTHLAGSRVVEAGAGEGYGADLLLDAGAGAVVGLEYDAACCAHAARTYPRVATVRANLAGLPLRAGSTDAVVALQVVEHLWDLPGFLRDCRVALGPGGLLAVTTPNRLTFSPGLGRGQRPTNPFHVEEFDAGQLAGLLAAAGFTEVTVAGLAHGRRLTDWESRHGSIVAAQVRAVLAGTWPESLLDTVAGVSPDDFTWSADAVPDSLDLLALGRAAP